MCVCMLECVGRVREHLRKSSRWARKAEEASVTFETVERRGGKGAEAASLRDDGKQQSPQQTNAKCPGAERESKSEPGLCTHECEAECSQ